VPGEKAVRGGVLRVALADDVDFLDPQRAGLPPAVALMHVMFRGLMAFPPTTGSAFASPVPDLADGMPAVTPDGRTYTFHLREGVSFGPPASRTLHAADVVAGLTRLVATGSLSPFASYFHVIDGADAFASHHARTLSGVTAPDDRTVVIKLARPVNDLLWILALPAAAAVPADLTSQPRPAPAAISPSGPYMLAPDGYVPETSIHLVRNPAWQPSTDPVRPAYVDEIRVTIEADGAAVRSALAAQSADLSLDTEPDLAALARDASLRGRALETPSGCLRYLWMNTTVAPLTSVSLRRTIAATIDRGAVLRAEGGSLAGVLSVWPIVRTVLGARPDAPSSIYGTPSHATPPPKPTVTLRLVVGDRATDVAEARAVQGSLAAAGIAVRVETMPIASLYLDGYELPRLRIPMGIATWCADWPGLGGRGMLAALLDGRHIPATGNQDYSMLNDATLERLMDAAATAPATSAPAAWQAAAQRAVDLAPWAPLVDLNDWSLVSARIGSLAATPMFPRGDLAAVWIRP